MPVPRFDIVSFVKLWTVPNYRLPKFLAAVNSFLSGISWKNGIFMAYMNGDPQAPYNSGVTYNTGNSVAYNFSTYESLVDSNTGNAPDINPDKWVLRCKSFIGASERVKYNGRYLNLTYQLNRYFQQQITDAGLTGFRQPPYPAPYDFGLSGGTWSDIYITNVARVSTSFIMKEIADGGSIMYATYSTGWLFNPPVYAIASTYTFDINIPLPVFNALGATDSIREAVVRGFADKYVASGTRYNVVTY